MAAAHGEPVRVAARVNPGILLEGHPYVATAAPGAKFGMPEEEAFDVLRRAEESPHLIAEGIHLHLGSQILASEPLEQSLASALRFLERARRSGLRLRLVNLGGGFGIDYQGEGREFPLEDYARRWKEKAAGWEASWAIEPGRWLVGPCAVLVTRVRWCKRQNGRRLVVLQAGMNDLLRPALYGARHRVEVVAPRGDAVEPAVVVGPLCESADVFTDDALLPPLEADELVALRDVGAYGYSMASNYNGRGRLGEVVVRRRELRLARAPEDWTDLMRGARDEEL